MENGWCSSSVERRRYLRLRDDRLVLRGAEADMTGGGLLVSSSVAFPEAIRCPRGQAASAQEEANSAASASTAARYSAGVIVTVSTRAIVTTGRRPEMVPG